LGTIKSIGKAYLKSKLYDEIQDYYMPCLICGNNNRIHKVCKLTDFNKTEYVFTAKCEDCKVTYESPCIGALTRGNTIHK
jgi:hypothetical protein